MVQFKGGVIANIVMYGICFNSAWFNSKDPKLDLKEFEIKLFQFRMV